MSENDKESLYNVSGNKSSQYYRLRKWHRRLADFPSRLPDREQYAKLTEIRMKILHDMYGEDPKEVRNILGGVELNYSVIDELRHMEEYTGWVECIDQRRDRKDTHANVYKITEKGEEAYEKFKLLVEDGIA